MGTIFRRSERRPVPQTADIIEKAGQRFARWRSRGKIRTVRIELAPDGSECVNVESGTYVAKFRDHSGRVVERSTGCREETTARHKLGQWEREQEQIRSGILDAGQLETARTAAGSIEPHLDAYEQSLIAHDVSAIYKANAIRAIRRLIDDLRLVTLSDLRREKIGPWLACAIADGMGARTRNYYRDAVARFMNWCQDTGRVREHNLGKLPKADEREDPRRKRRALTEDELGRLLAVARSRPLDDARTIRRGERKGEQSAELRPAVVKRLDDLGRERFSSTALSFSPACG